MDVVARFRLTVRCRACLLASTHVLDVPDVADAPIDADELEASAFLQHQPLACLHCGERRVALISTAQLAIDSAG